MPTAAENVWRSAPDNQKNIIKAIWPALYEAFESPYGKLARCMRTDRHTWPDVPAAVGRVTLNGQPACQRCLDWLLPAGRPRILKSGYPLEGVMNPAAWRREHGL